MSRDPWREADHLTKLHDMDNPETNLYHGTTKDDPNRSPYPGRIYAVYDIRPGNNRVYIGSTFQGWERRLLHHYQTATGNKCGDSLFYRWLLHRVKGISFEEAKEFIKLTVIRHVWFDKFQRSREKALVDYEKQMIGQIDTKRLLNVNLIDKKSRTDTTRRMIREALACDSLEATRQFLRDWETKLMGAD
jgi:predicted GIY-YIG superfamily endonuclease